MMAKAPLTALPVGSLAACAPRYEVGPATYTLVHASLAASRERHPSLVR